MVYTSLMNKSQYITITGTIFAIVGLLHLIRVVYDWPVSIGSWDVPLFVSILAVLLAGFLVFHAWKFRR